MIHEDGLHSTRAQHSGRGRSIENMRIALRRLGPGGLGLAAYYISTQRQPLQENRRLEDSYDLLEELGEGAYGVVYKGWCKQTGTEVAVKKLEKKAESEDAIRHEMAMLTRVGLHRGVAALLDHYETSSAFYLVMEYVAGGEVSTAPHHLLPFAVCHPPLTPLPSTCHATQLFDRIVDQGSFSEARAAGYIRQIADAVAFLHSQGLCHADIKPENLLLTSHGADADVRLVDFGLAHEARNTSDHKPGTWAYWPPEAFGEDGAVGKQTDMWSIGCVLFVMIGGYHPFDPEGEGNDKVLQERICTCEPDFDDPVWDEASPEAIRVIRQLLSRDPINVICLPPDPRQPLPRPPA